jgi:hypothetical protein
MIQNLPLLEKLRALFLPPDPSSTRVEAVAEEEDTRCQKSDVAMSIPQTSEARNTRGEWEMLPKKKQLREQVACSS